MFESIAGDTKHNDEESSLLKKALKNHLPEEDSKLVDLIIDIMVQSTNLSDPEKYKEDNTRI